MLVFDGKTYTYQEEFNGGQYGFNELTVRDEDGKRVETVWGSKVQLENVQVGDWVVFVHSERNIPTSHTLRKVERVTKTQFTVNGTRYLKRCGHRVGSKTGYYRSQSSYIIAYNQEDEICWWARYFTNKEEMRIENELKEAKATLKARFLEMLADADIDHVNEMLDILKGETK